MPNEVEYSSSQRRLHEPRCQPGIDVSLRSDCEENLLSIITQSYNIHNLKLTYVIYSIFHLKFDKLNSSHVFVARTQNWKGVKADVITINLSTKGNQHMGEKLHTANTAASGERQHGVYSNDVIQHPTAEEEGRHASRQQHFTTGK
ncbi:uncharacterized protein LOC125499980 [Athalia rosae]|uniref:uncharacterized protein LOC125499980 n=1 Tax=Athalia rosae TaxID=37344 RepID=UPI00203341B2|nr:uncharacterized protein LOC125499980 [Athalia rosae]